VAENRGKHGDGGLLEVDRRLIAWRTSKTEASFYSRASRGSNAGLCKDKGREVMARCGGIAAGRACAHAVQRSSDNGRYEGHTRGGFVRTPVSDGELDRGSASRCPRGATRGARAPCLPGNAHAGAVLHRGLDGVLSTMSTQPAG
jgi:hypothetical protein